MPAIAGTVVNKLSEQDTVLGKVARGVGFLLAGIMDIASGLMEEFTAPNRTTDVWGYEADLWQLKYESEKYNYKLPDKDNPCVQTNEIIKQNKDKLEIGCVNSNKCLELE